MAIRSMRHTVSIRLYVIGLVMFAFVFILCILYVSYKKKVKQLRTADINLKQLGKKIKDYSKTIQDYSSKVEYLEKDGKTITEELNRKRRILDQKERQIKDLASKLETTESLKDAATQNLQKYQEQVTGLKNKIETLNKQNDSKATTIETLTGECDWLRETNNELKKSINDKDSKCKELTSQLENKEEECEQLKKHQRSNADNPIERLL